MQETMAVLTVYHIVHLFWSVTSGYNHPRGSVFDISITACIYLLAYRLQNLVKKQI